MIFASFIQFKNALSLSSLSFMQFDMLMLSILVDANKETPIFVNFEFSSKVISPIFCEQKLKAESITLPATISSTLALILKVGFIDSFVIFCNTFICSLS